MAKVSGGYLVTASVPETDALADRFANKWVRKHLRELAAVGVARPKVTHLGADPESRAPCAQRSGGAQTQVPSRGKAWLRDEPLHRIFDFQCQRCCLLSNVAFDVRLGV
jgi:predicted  nucleic acid-binding Zn ribbon protein